MRFNQGLRWFQEIYETRVTKIYYLPRRPSEMICAEVASFSLSDSLGVLTLYDFSRITKSLLYRANHAGIFKIKRFYSLLTYNHPNFKQTPRLIPENQNLTTRPFQQIFPLTPSEFLILLLILHPPPHTGHLNKIKHRSTTEVVQCYRS